MSCEYKDMPSHTARQMMPKLDLPQGVPPLNSLYLYISGSCNLACKHCWITPTYQKGVENGHNIKLSYIQQAIQEAKPLGLRSVKLTGGEPTIHPQFRELVTLISKSGLDFGMETNGTLIDRKMAEFLKGASHFTFISVSIDGASAEIHDDMRGVPGSYKKALTGIRNLVEVGFRPQIICTLHKGNVSHIEKLIQLAESMGCSSVKFNFVQRIGRGEAFAKEHGLEVNEIVQLCQQLDKRLAQQSKVRIHFSIPFAFYSISRLLRGSLGRCRVLNILGILAGGEISLCGIGVNEPELIFGHMSENNLCKIWCQSASLIRLRKQIPAELEGICKNCLHRNVCLGACIADNYYHKRKLNAPYSFCEEAEAMGLFPPSRKRLEKNEKVKGEI